MNCLIDVSDSSLIQFYIRKIFLVKHTVKINNTTKIYKEKLAQVDFLYVWCIEKKSIAEGSRLD